MVSEAMSAARQLLDAESALIASISVTAEEQLEAIANDLIGLQGKVFFVGAGTSGYVARRAAHLFSVCGTPAVYMQPADALHGSIAAIQPQDALIALSKGGATTEVNRVIVLAKEIGVPVFALSCVEESEMADLADETVVLPADDVSDPGGLIAMGSTLAHSAWLDALAYVLMRAKAYDFDHVLHTHPSGAVGQKTTLPPDLTPIKLSTPNEGIQK